MCPFPLLVLCLEIFLILSQINENLKGIGYLIVFRGRNVCLFIFLFLFFLSYCVSNSGLLLESHIKWWRQLDGSCSLQQTCYLTVVKYLFFLCLTCSILHQFDWALWYLPFTCCWTFGHFPKLSHSSAQNVHSWFLGIDAKALCALMFIKFRLAVTKREAGTVLVAALWRHCRTSEHFAKARLGMESHLIIKNQTQGG